MKPVATLICATLFMAGPAAAQTLRALVIGANDYAHEIRLAGAVNDAIGIAAAVRPFTPDLVVLRDRAVTRATVLRAWGDALQRSKPGDTLLVTFSGHGGREWVGVTPAAPRGFREFWVMPDFDRKTEAGKANRIMAPEIEAMIHKAHAAGVQTLLLADHCYSGAVYRGNGLDASRIRQVPMLSAPGAPPFERAPDVSETDASPPPPGVTSLGANRADTPVAEFRIEQTREVHGALSFAFAYALTRARSDIDPDGSGEIRRGALLGYLQRVVNQVTQGEQEPQLRPAFPADDVLFRLPPTRAVPPASPDPDLAVAVHVKGLPAAAARAWVETVPGAVWADSPDDARLIWDWHGGTPRLLTGLSRFVSFDADKETLPAAVAKVRNADVLNLRAASGRMRVEIATPGDKPRPLYIEGETLAIRVTGLAGPNLVVLNLDWRGEPTLLYPRQKDATIAWPIRAVPLDEVKVTAPFGEDFVVAVSSKTPLSALLADLAAITADSKNDRAALVRQAVERVMTENTDAKLAAASLFTAPAAMRCTPEVIRDSNMATDCAAQPR